MRLPEIPAPRQSVIIGVGAGGALVLIMLMAVGAANWRQQANDRAEPSPQLGECHDVMVVSVERAEGEKEPRSLFEYYKQGKAYRMARMGSFGAVGDRFTYCDYYSQPK